METTRVLLHGAHKIGPVDPRVFGGFLEHIGRAVYDGVYEPGGPHGRRRRASAPTCSTRCGRLQHDRHALPRRQLRLRLPLAGRGRARALGRPTVRDLAWQSLEPNPFGTDEFIALCRTMGWTPMLTVNLGTGTPEEARDWVEYCNCPPGHAATPTCARRTGTRSPTG